MSATAEAAGGTAIAKRTNIGIKSDVVDMVGFAVETYGSLDILVNNAQSWGTRDQPTGLPVPTPHHRPDPRRGRRVVSTRLTRRPLRATPLSVQQQQQRDRED